MNEHREGDNICITVLQRYKIPFKIASGTFLVGSSSALEDAC